LPLPNAAVQSFDQQQRITAAAVAGARRAWSGMAGDWTRSWASVGGRLVLLATAAQLAIAREAADSFPVMVAELGLPTENAGVAIPEAVAGTAGDGRDLEGLLYGSVVTAREAGVSGATTEQALAAGGSALDMYMTTLMADAAREIGSAALASYRGVFGYIRMLRPPSCARCAVLAGKWFGWDAGFQRHESCDCKHVPCGNEQAADLVSDPLQAIRDGQVTGLSKAQRTAILDDGADASRGMRTADIGGRTVQITTEGTTKHGYANLVRKEIAANRAGLTSWAEFATQGGRSVKMPRLTVGEIYRISSDREDVIRLLHANGYVRPARGEPVADVARRAG
jgi:hypothetical protein